MECFFWALNENNFNPRILYPAKLSFKIDGARKVFHNKQKLQQYMTIKSPLQKILQGILHTESEKKQTIKGQESANHRRRKIKKVERNIDSAAHNLTLKKQRKLNDKNHHIPINTNTEY
jgi:hypothetical protein